MKPLDSDKFVFVCKTQSCFLQEKCLLGLAENGGFQIPNGNAVYTKKGAIHCDAGLTGQYLVGYTTSEDYSTVLLRSEFKDEIVKIHFV